MCLWLAEIILDLEGVSESKFLLEFPLGTGKSEEKRGSSCGSKSLHHLLNLFGDLSVLRKMHTISGVCRPSDILECTITHLGTLSPLLSFWSHVGSVL